MFNSLVAKEKRTIKIVDGSACEVIGTGIIKIIERDQTVCALEAVMYVPEVLYNFISIRYSTKKDARSK